MSHIIVLPYWCEGELRNFLQVFTIWELFCKSKSEYSFIIAPRFDAPSSPELLAECERRAPTEVLVCDRYKWTGWPAGANGMFRHVMEHVRDTRPQDGGFVFWFEHDVIPIYIDWLDWLASMWRPEMAVMGQYMSPPWINLHQMPMNPNINGTACYGKSLADNAAFKSIVPDRCFDFTLSEQLPATGAKSVALPLLYDLWFMMPDWVRRCDLTKLMINGIKYHEQRETIIRYILNNRDS